MLGEISNREITIPSRISFAIGTALFCASFATSAVAQSYPTRPVKIIVPFAPEAWTSPRALWRID
jgi:hypothetical protein